MKQSAVKYHTMLELSSTIANQPSVQTVLQNLYQLLSAILPCDTAAILLLTEHGRSIRLGAFEKGISGLDIEVGIEGNHAGTAVDRALEEQTPVYISDFRAELETCPGVDPQTLKSTLCCGYAFPLSTAKRKLGVLCIGREQQGRFSNEDLALMTSVAAHVSSTLESAITTDAADIYQRRLLDERNRWKLLLDINNHIVSHLHINELLRAASSSLRQYFANDFAGIWVVDKERNLLKNAVMDFPNSNEITDFPVSRLSSHDLGKIRKNMSEIWTKKDLHKFEPMVEKRLMTEAIESLAITPLSTANGPLGILALGSRRPGFFRTEDLDLLAQVGTQISLALDNALAYAQINASKEKIEEERLYLESEIRSEYNFEDIIGKSQSLSKVLKQIAVVAPTDSTVLLHGETGTGKELIARAIHSLSSRKNRTFVRLNCAALPAGLIESELFGHEKGAFTGATTQKKGRFEIADQGTLFLDEIGDIALELQPKLLRALQEREFERLGSSRTINVDVRVIAATHRNLQTMIQNDQFREDLFYRLNVFPVEIPPLRERREDIPILVSYFVSRLSRRMQKNIHTVPKQAMKAMMEAPWPGNVRELENFIERAVILSDGTELNIPMGDMKRSSARTSIPAVSFEAAEKQAILAALKASSGKISGTGGAAERLGLKRTTLQNKMRRIGISRFYD